MSDDRNRGSRGGTLTVWLVAAVALPPVLYVLSVGPAFWLCGHGYLHPSVYYSAYFPIITLRDHCESFRCVIDWYAVLWGASPP